MYESRPHRPYANTHNCLFYTEVILIIILFVMQTSLCNIILSYNVKILHCVYVYVCVWMLECVCVDVCVCMLMYVCVCVGACLCVCVYMYMCMSVRVYVCMCVCMCMSTCLRFVIMTPSTLSLIVVLIRFVKNSS